MGHHTNISQEQRRRWQWWYRPQRTDLPPALNASPCLTLKRPDLPPTLNASPCLTLKHPYLPPILKASPCFERLSLLWAPHPALKTSPCFERLTLLWTPHPALNASPCFERLTLLCTHHRALNASPCLERLTPPDTQVLFRCFTLHYGIFLISLFRQVVETLHDYDQVWSN